MASTPIIGSLLPDIPNNLKIGDYILKHKLGAGKYGCVFLAHSEKYNVDFALKIITKVMDDNNDQSNEIFRREAATLRTVCHPNVVSLYDFFEDQLNFYLVMEFCSGGTLLKTIQTNGFLRKADIQYYFGQILQALQFCHSREIVHRDLKPENILIDSAGRPKIGDWGQSRNFSTQELLTTYCGTASYAAPELHMKMPYHGPACDMWSFGVCLFAAATGKMPWKSQTTFGKIKEIVNCEYLIPPNVDADIANVIRSLLILDPPKRATAMDVLQMPLFKNNSKLGHTMTPQPDAGHQRPKNSVPFHHFASSLKKTGVQLTVVPVRSKLTRKSSSQIYHGNEIPRIPKTKEEIDQVLASMKII